MTRSLLLDVEADGVDLVGTAANRRPFALFKMTWTTAYVNSLPDSSFAYVEPGAAQDKGKRHLPYKDKDGKVDLPHLRNALARLDQTDIPATAKAKARATLEAAARKAGVGDHGTKSSGGVMDATKLTKAQFIERLTKAEFAVDEDISDKKLGKIARSFNVELTDVMPAPKGDDDPEPQPTKKSVLDTILKALGGKRADDPDPLTKSQLDPETRTYITALEKRVATREAADKARAEKKLAKRIEKLVQRGAIEEDETAGLTKREVKAIEKAQERFEERLKKAGVFEAFGEQTRETDEPGTLKELVFKGVVDYLGREPISKEEEVEVRQKLYKANPGLQAAVLREEREQRTAGRV